MIKINDISSALNEFETAAIKHTEATETGDYKVANKNYTVITTVTKYLKDKNEINLLAKFMNNPNVGVKLWAASYLLNTTLKNEAVNALQDITKTKGIFSLDAETVLIECEKGNLQL